MNKSASIQKLRSQVNFNSIATKPTDNLNA